MGLTFLAILGLLVLSPVSRRIALVSALVVAGYIAFDNLATEAPVKREYIQLRNVESYIFGEDTPSPMVKIGFDARNGSRDDLESVDLLLTLRDCTVAFCEDVGRQITRVQLLAPAYTSRHAETLVRFQNIAAVESELVPEIRLLGGTADNF